MLYQGLPPDPAGFTTARSKTLFSSETVNSADTVATMPLRDAY